jgi:chemotaxis protein CheX
LEPREIASGLAEPVTGEIRDSLLEPFIAGTCAAVGEMAGTNVAVRAVYRPLAPCQPAAADDIYTVLQLTSPGEGALVVSFPHRTAAALAKRILAGVTEQLDENLIRDCVGEIANVVAGQAKALLAESPYRFTFSMPTVLADATTFRPKPTHDCLAIGFHCDEGDFLMQLFLTR